MSFLKKYSEQTILAAILVLAAILRFYRYADWSLSNDELSAISRLNFADLNELLKQGVRPDYHPAGVQVFLFYWIKIFGNAVWAVRLPFVLCGIGSVYFTYLIAKKWFSVQTAQFSALVLACLTYPILYSQLARPYSPGLLFSLMMVYYWSKLLFDTNSSKKTMIGYAISTALCMYMHYFSFLFAIIVGGTGLFFMRSNNYKDYLLAALLAVIAFTPHISISLEQLSRGGIGSWLGKPSGDFFTEYLLYSGNNSGIVILIAFAVIFISVLPGILQKQDNGFRIISLLWFMIPFLIGYFYSIHVNPVLQYSILLFSFPFLLIFLFSYIKDLSGTVNTTLLSVFAALLIWTGVSGQKFYEQKPFSSFKELVENDIAWTAKYGEKNIRAVYNVISPAYLDYYFLKNPKKSVSPHSYYASEEAAAFNDFSKIIAKDTTRYFIYGWSNNICPPELYEIIKRKYPKIIGDHVYFNSRITLFERDAHYSRKPLFTTSIDLGKKPGPGWNYDMTKLDSVNVQYASNLFYYKKFIFMDSTTEFSGGYEGKLSDLYADSIAYLNIEAQISLEGEDCALVLEFHRAGNDSLYGWYPGLSFHSIKENGETILLTQKIPSSYRKGDKIKVYVWNPHKGPMRIGNISITSFADMDYEPIYELK